MMAWRLVAEKNNRACDRQKSRQLLSAVFCCLLLCLVHPVEVFFLVRESSDIVRTIVVRLRRVRRVVCHQLSPLDCGPSPVIASCDGDR
jgi:hypothetical protein